LSRKKQQKIFLNLTKAGPDELFADLEDAAPIKNVDDMVHVKVNFPPFQHYKIDENNSFICVGSHGQVT